MRRRLHRLVWRLAEPPPLPPLVVQAIKVAVASGIAWAVGQAVTETRPFTAVLAVIILMQGHAYGSLLSAIQFLLGMIGGLLLGIAAARLGFVSPVVLALVIFVCMLAGGWLRVSRQGFNNNVAVSALLVLASNEPQSLERLGETGLGAFVGFIVAAFLWPPNPVHGLREQYRDIRARAAADIRRTLAVAGRRTQAGANRRSVRSNAERADAAVAEIAPAEDALRWNPWHARRVYDLSQLEDRLRLISYLYRTIRAVARQAEESPMRAGAELQAAGAVAVEAMNRRLAGRDVEEAVAHARRHLAAFAGRAPSDPHALAIAAALDDFLADVQGWRPPNRVDPERRLVARVARARRRIRERSPRWARGFG